MGKSYLRYKPAQVLGVVASSCVICSGRAGDAAPVLFTGLLGSVGVWSVKQGTIVRAGRVGRSCVRSPRATLPPHPPSPPPLPPQLTTLTPASAAPRAEATVLALSPNGALLALGYSDGSLVVFDVALRTPSMVLHGHARAISALAWSSGGGRLASGSRDTDIVLWDVLSETGLARLRGHSDEVTGLAFLPTVGGGGASPDDAFLASSSKDSLVKVWDTGGRGCVQTVGGVRVEVWSLTITPEGDRLLAGCGDDRVRVWAVPSVAPPALDTLLVGMGTLTRSTHERAAHVLTAGRLLLVQAAGKSVEVFRRRSQSGALKRVARRLKRHREKMGKKAKGEAAAPAQPGDEFEFEDGGFALAGTSLADVDAALAALEAAGLAAAGGAAPTAHSPFTIAGDEWELVCIATASSKVQSIAALPSPPGATSLQLALALTNNVVEMQTIPLTSEAGTALKCVPVTTPSGVVVAGGVAGKTLGGTIGHRTDVRGVAVSSDGALVLSVAGACGKVWNVKTGDLVRSLDCGEGASGLCGAFTPGDRHAVIGCKDGRLLLFELSSGDLLEAHDAHAGPLWGLAVRPDGKSMATGGADKCAKFWDFDVVEVAPPAPAVVGKKAKRGGAGAGPTPPPVRRLTLVHARTLQLTDEVLCVRYTPSTDPARVLFAVGLLDATVKVFFEDTLKFFLSLYGHKLPVLAMDVSRDGTLLVTASADKNVKLWGLDFGDW